MSLRPIIADTEGAAWDKANKLLADVERKTGAAPQPTNTSAERLLGYAARGDVHDERLWMGIARATGAPGNTSCLVGTPDQVSAAVLEYYRLGIHSFLLRGFENPHDTVAIGRELIPRIKAGALDDRPAGRSRRVASPELQTPQDAGARHWSPRRNAWNKLHEGCGCRELRFDRRHLDQGERRCRRSAAGEVRVKIGAAAVGFVDGLKVQGLYQTKDPLPFAPGTEFAGTVDAVADDVTAFKPGMPVLGMIRSGALAEYISVPSAALKHLPAQVPFEAGASFQANYLTGLYALEARAQLRAGETLLVLGAAGGVGIAAVQIGKLMGARVIAAASTPEKRAFAVQIRRG